MQSAGTRFPDRVPARRTIGALVLGASLLLVSTASGCAAGYQPYATTTVSTPVVQAEVSAPAPVVDTQVQVSAPAEAQVQVVQPDLVTITPDVQVVAAYDSEPVFYTGGFYWREYNGGWYRSHSHNAGWEYHRDAPYSVRSIDNRGSYRNYRPAGYTPRYADRGYDRRPSYQPRPSYDRSPAYQPRPSYNYDRPSQPTGYGRPTGGYDRPQQTGYNRPQQTWNRPQSSYGQATGYNRPQQTNYGRPQQTGGYTRPNTYQPRPSYNNNTSYSGGRPAYQPRPSNNSYSTGRPAYQPRPSYSGGRPSYSGNNGSSYKPTRSTSSSSSSRSARRR